MTAVIHPTRHVAIDQSTWDVYTTQFYTAICKKKKTEFVV